MSNRRVDTQLQGPLGRAVFELPESALTTKGALCKQFDIIPALRLMAVATTMAKLVWVGPEAESPAGDGVPYSRLKS
jgi:hypothetical protein